MNKLEKLIEFFSMFSKEDVIFEWNFVNYCKNIDGEIFKEWHGGASVEAVVREKLFNKLLESKVEAKIISGELEPYPYENRTTKDGYLDVDNIAYDEVDDTIF